jgi:hypothetical protein
MKEGVTDIPATPQNGGPHINAKSDPREFIESSGSESQLTDKVHLPCVATLSRYHAESG